MKLNKIKKSLLSLLVTTTFMSTVTISNAKSYKVFIDPGHGGRDNGSVYDSYLEDKLNLEIAKKVEVKLKEDGINVIMSREDDTFVSLKERTKASNESKADLFVSIHQNAAEVREASGIETYYRKDNEELAKAIQKNLLESTKGNDRGVRTKNLEVLRDNEIPAVLVECGFISNKSEGYKLNTKEYQEKVADGIVKGIKSYLGINEVKSSKSSIKTATVLNNGVKVRRGRGLVFNTIGELKAGTKVTIIDTMHDWHKINYGYGYGYVSGVYVK